MSRHVLPKEYLNVLSGLNEINLLIAGKDPFPTKPVGIPFCKETWKEQKNKTCSGYYVLQSLGVDTDIAEKEFKSPKDLFMHLAKNKIGLINICYDFLEGKAITGKHLNELAYAEEINKEILIKSNFVILCGQANNINRYKMYKHIANKCIEVVHPDVRNKNSADANRKKIWKEWWSNDALKRKYKLNI